MVVANEMEDPGAKATGKGERLMSKEAKLVRGTHSCIQRLTSGEQWKVDPVEK